MIRSSEKKIHTIPAVIAAVVLLVGIAVLSVNIREITVTGNSRYTEEELVDRIFQNNFHWNTTFCYLYDRFGEHQQIPFVEDYSLVFHTPFHVEVIVHEKSVVGYVSYMSSYMYFDKDGIIVESTNEKLEGIPCITGLKFGQIVLHQPLPVEEQTVFEEILNLTQILEVYGLQVDKIQFDSKDQATLCMGGLEVFLGNNSELDGKISELSDMMPQLEGLSGILYLDTYDPNNSRTMFTFKKK